MKGFEEKKGQFTRIAFDSETGRFVSKGERHPFLNPPLPRPMDQPGTVIDLPRAPAAGRAPKTARRAIRKIARISARSA